MIIKTLSVLLIAVSLLFASTMFATNVGMDECFVYSLTGGACYGSDIAISLHHISMASSIAKYIIVVDVLLLSLLFMAMTYIGVSFLALYSPKLASYINLNLKEFYFYFFKDIRRWLSLKNNLNLKIV